MRILILSSRFPFPIEKGDKLRIYHQIKELSKSHEICLVATSDQEISEDALTHIQSFCQEVHVFPIKKAGILWSLIKAIFSPWPFQVHYFYRKSYHKKIKEIADAFRPHRVYCQLIRMAPYVKDLAERASLDYMDCFSLGMARRAQAAKGLKKLLFNWEAHRLKKYEDQVFLDFHSHSIISEQDKVHLETPYQKEVMVIPNGVDLDYFSPPKKIEASYELLFVGNMGYAPNVMAARYLAKRILPEIRKELPEARLLLAGARPGKEIMELEKEAGVVVGGWYEDIRDAYCEGSLFVAPLFTGSGQQNKILEAMSMELPCITTELVNNAIGAKLDKEILLAGNLEEFVEKCLLLLQKKRKLKSIGKAGRRFVEANYSWEKSHEQLEILLKKSVSISR